MPQTVREAPGERFQVLWRVYSTAHAPEDRWSHCPMPKFMSETKWVVAKDLSKPEAVCVREYWTAKPGCGCFEFAIKPMPAMSELNEQGGGPEPQGSRPLAAEKP